MSDVNGVMWWYSRAYLYVFVSLFIYVILSVFISVIMDTYETLKVLVQHSLSLCVCVWMYVSKVIYNCRIKFKLSQVLRNITVYGMDKFLDVLWMWWVIV